MSDVVKVSVMESPVESLTIASTARGVCWIGFGSGDHVNLALLRWCKRWLRTEKVEYDEEGNRDVIGELDQYFRSKRKMFDIPLDMKGTPFQLKVWRELLNIPYGETRSYKNIAIGKGATKAVRAIGNANHNNPLSIVVPCHRVIGSNGALVGYGGGIHIKKYLLAMEKGLLEEKNKNLDAI